MSERERWMPSRETFLSVVYGLDPMDPERTFAQDTQAVGDLLRTAVNQALAEQEARHKREVIEARIDTLTAHGDCVCPIYSVYGERLSAVDPECVVCSALKRLESELAAMEVKP